MKVLAFLALPGAVGMAGVIVTEPPPTAARYFINPDPRAMSAVEATVFGAKFRMSNSGFDQWLSNGPDTLRLPNLGNTYLTANLGNNKTLSSRTYAFTLQHDLRNTFTFSLVPLGGTKPAKPSTLVWSGNLATGLAPLPWPAGLDASPAAGALPIRPVAAFNSLSISAQALADGRGTADSRSLSFSHLTFVSPTLSCGGGTFAEGLITPDTAGPGSPWGIWTQQLIAEAPLSAHEWTLAGELHGVRSGSAEDEYVRFTIFGQQADVDWTYVVVPEPSSLAFGGVFGLLGFIISRAAIHRRN